MAPETAPVKKAAVKNAPTTRAVQAAETKRRLIDAAIDIFSARHYDDVAVADIVRSAGVAHGLLWHHFGSKRGLYLAAMHEAATQLDAAFIVDPTLSPAEQVRRAFTAHLRYLADHRGLALQLVLGGRGADAQAWAVFESGRRRAMRGVATVLGLDPANPALTMMGRAAVGAIDEAAVYWLEHDEPFDVETMADCFVSVIVSALRSAHDIDPDLAIGAAVRALRKTTKVRSDVQSRR